MAGNETLAHLQYYEVEMQFHAIGYSDSEEPILQVCILARSPLDAIHKAWVECELRVTEEPNLINWFQSLSLHVVRVVRLIAFPPATEQTKVPTRIYQKFRHPWGMELILVYNGELS